MHDPIEAFRASILAALCHAPDHIEPGRLHRFATGNRRGDTAGWCKLFEDRRGGVFGCYRQGISDQWCAHNRETMTPSERADLAQHVARAAAEREAQQRQQWAENAGRIEKLWAQCQPLVPGDPVTLYVKARGMPGVWPLPDLLRYHSALPYWHDDGNTTRHPAMVAPLIGPDGRMLALHRTYLSRDGRKADLPTVKKLTGTAGPLTGACIPLFKPRAGVLGIAEGIETALAAWCASAVPVVAAYSAGALAAWRWPQGLQRIVVFADFDKAGQEAADSLRARALAAHLPCEVLTPTTEGADWCDVWAGRDATRIEGGTP